MLCELHGSCLFNIKSGYHQIIMKKDDKWKTTFKNKYGLYERFVMSFGLTNTTNTFYEIDELYIACIHS